MRRVRQDHRKLELRLGASISVHRLSSYGIRMIASQTPLGTISQTANVCPPREITGLTSGLPRVVAGYRQIGAVGWFSRRKLDHVGTPTSVRD
jgi:hypothetical protein